MIFFIIFFIFFHFSLEECVYVTKAGDTWDSVAKVMGCGSSNAILSPRWYAEKHQFNRAVLSRPLTANQFITIPENCYQDASGKLTRPPGCQITNDCTNGNAEGVCQVCIETNGAFECGCRSGDKPSGGQKCSPRFDTIDEKPQPIYCVDTKCPASDVCKSEATHRCRGPSAKCTPNNSALGYACSCSDENYEVKDFTCVDKNECLNPNTCAGKALGSSCENLSPGYRCECGNGFKATPDRKACEPLMELCENFDCVGGKCVLDATNANGFKCVCEDGLVLVGQTCVEQNSVGSINNCGGLKCSGPSVKCGVNSDLGKNFCACEDQGYEVKNKTTCVDKNECEGFYNPCGSTTMCVNKVGGYECTCASDLETYIELANICVSVCGADCGVGTCTANGCECPDGYTADFMNGCLPDCSAIGNCNLNGKCIAPNVCECFMEDVALDPLTCAETEPAEFCHTIVFDFLDDPQLPSLDGKQTQDLTVCSVSVTLTAEGGVFSIQGNLRGALGVIAERKRQNSEDEMKGMVTKGQAIRIDLAEPSPIVHVEFGKFFSEDVDFARIVLDGEGEPLIVNKNFWTPPDDRKVNFFTIYHAGGDGFDLESFAVRNPRLKQNTEPPDFPIDLQESIETYFWLWILFAVLGVVVCVTSVAVWRRRELARALRGMRSTQQYIDENDKNHMNNNNNDAVIYGQDDEYRWSHHSGATMKTKEGTIKPLAPARKKTEIATFI